MANTIRFLSKLKPRIFSSILTPPIYKNQVRLLFSQEAMGMPSYLTSRKYYKNKFLNIEDQYRGRLMVHLNEESNSPVFTEDLKTFIHVMDSTPEDFKLLEVMLLKFAAGNDQLRFSSYVFGPVIMRAFHMMNNVEGALKLFLNPKLEHFFTQVGTYFLLLDLLYINNRFADMRRVTDVIRAKTNAGQAVYPRNALILIFAGLYRENTKESFEYGCNIWVELRERGHIRIRRVILYLTALALKQEQPQMAYEMVTTAGLSSFIAIRCLMIMTHVALDRLYEVVPYLRSSLNSHSRPERFFRDTIETIEAAIEKNKVEPDSEIVRLLQEIKARNLVESDTLDDYLQREIVDSMYVREKIRENSWKSDSDMTKRARRPGLQDIM